MKFKLLFASALAITLFGCTNSKKENKSDEPIDVINVDEPIDSGGKDKKITDRDFSVTPKNAYNDLMLDSLAMEQYIVSRRLSDKKISLRIRSFYNARNYHYAWFSSNGLTEQARFFWNQYDYAVTHLKDTTLINSEFYKHAERYLNQEKMTANSKDSLIRNTEFGFTEHFIRYINSTYEKGYVKRKNRRTIELVKIHWL